MSYLRIDYLVIFAPMLGLPDYVYLYMEKTNQLIKFLVFRKYFGYCLYQFTIFLCTNFVLKVVDSLIPIEPGTRLFKVQL